MPERRLMGNTLEEKLLLNRRIDGDCWLWTGCTTSTGYGRVYVSGQGQRAVHRVAYEMWVGEVREGLELDHLCNQRSCFRPDHLDAVTHRENLARAVIRGSRGSRDSQGARVCANGHLLVGANIKWKKRTRREAMTGRVRTVALCRTCFNDRRREQRARRRATQ